MVSLSGNWIQQIVTILTLMHSLSLYHGYLYDYESGLYYNQGRCYSSSWGRYVSPESPEKLTERSDNPLDANLYLFCNNNTVNKLDTVASWSRDYSGVEWQANGFDIRMNEMFASRSICMIIANQIIKKYGSWSPKFGYNFNEMNALRISSDLFAHYVGKAATAAINKVNACWGDGWILNNQKSDIIRVRNSDPNAEKYLKIWKAAPEIRTYALKEGIFISL
jgi:RHS repeat-associated protein